MSTILRALRPCLALALVASTPLRAEPERNPASPWYTADRDRWWLGEVGIGFELEPDYPGSDDAELEPELGLRGILKDRFGNRYFLELGDVSAVFDVTPNLAILTRLEYEEGREAENPALEAFDDGADTLEAELGLFRRFGRFSLGAVLQPDVLGRGKGLVGFLGAGFDTMLAGDRLRLGLRGDLSWADSEHMQTEFGIDAEQATRSGYPEYRPGGGLKSSTVGLSLEYSFSRRWSVLIDAEQELYFGRANDSPLIRTEGSRSTTELGMGVLFRF